MGRYISGASLFPPLCIGMMSDHLINWVMSVVVSDFRHIITRGFASSSLHFFNMMAGYLSGPAAADCDISLMAWIISCSSKLIISRMGLVSSF